jgi:hypothetical protein
MEEEVQLLSKLLNHKIFLDEFPGIRYVAVNKYGEGIDVVFLFSDGVQYSDYKKFGVNAYKMVRELSKMGGIRSRINIYPLV